MGAEAVGVDSGNEDETLPRKVNTAWPAWLRVAFRFCFVYWVLYVWPAAGQVSLLDLLPWDTDKLSQALAWPLARLAHLVGVYVFHLSGEAADWHPTGSGDTAMNYMLVFVVALLAVTGTAVWTAIDETRLARGRGPREYRTAYAWVRLLLRFTLAVTLLDYGYAKVFPSQFGLTPRLFELNETYGESSPMHVLWFMMGVSRPYTIFGGLAEVVPGALLLFRRTSTLGLLGAVAVLANVVALNFCYDVPVKLYSTHLLVMSLFLLLPDVRPMWHFFAERKDAVLTGAWVRGPERRGLRIGAHVLQGLVVLGAIWTGVQVYKSREMAQTPPPLRGIWAVDKVEGWPSPAGGVDWPGGGDGEPTKFSIESSKGLRMWTTGGKRIYYETTYDVAQHSLKLPKMTAPTAMQWVSADAKTASLQGTWMGKPVSIRMHRTDPDTYLVTSRGFHWVQEAPYNR